MCGFLYKKELMVGTGGERLAEWLRETDAEKPKHGQIWGRKMEKTAWRNTLGGIADLT